MPRYINKNAVAECRTMPCEICIWHDDGNCGHHLKTRGSGGGDEWFNLLPVCVKCHAKIHDYGYNKMIIKHPRLLKALIKRGWYKDENEKWKCIHYSERNDTK